jgi:hypothetical protein
MRLVSAFFDQVLDLEAAKRVSAGDIANDGGCFRGVQSGGTEPDEIGRQRFFADLVESLRDEGAHRQAESGCAFHDFLRDVDGHHHE